MEWLSSKNPYPYFYNVRPENTPLQRKQRRILRGNYWDGQALRNDEALISRVTLHF